MTEVGEIIEIEGERFRVLGIAKENGMVTRALSKLPDEPENGGPDE